MSNEVEIVSSEVERYSALRALQSIRIIAYSSQLNIHILPSDTPQPPKTQGLASHSKPPQVNGATDGSMHGVEARAS